MIMITSSFSKSFVFKMFSVHTKTQCRRFPKSVFEMLRFRDVLMKTEGLTAEIIHRFQISPALCGWSNSFKNHQEP